MTKTPVEIKLLQKQKTLKLRYEDGKSFEFSTDFLRRHSPSAQMKNPAMVAGIDPAVNIIQIEPVGNYALKFIFDDGHQSGLYTFSYLYELGQSLKKA